MTEDNKTNDFKKELTSLLNRYSWDNACETPDHILAEYVERYLYNYCSTIGINIAWHNWRKLEDDKAMKIEENWHYLAKGELPDKDGEYLCRYYKYGIRFSRVFQYRVKDNKWYNLVNDEEYRVPKPDAWQYIVPPKEEA